MPKRFARGVCHWHFQPGSCKQWPMVAPCFKLATNIAQPRQDDKNGCAKSPRSDDPNEHSNCNTMRWCAKNSKEETKKIKMHTVPRQTRALMETPVFEPIAKGHPSSQPGKLTNKAWQSNAAAPIRARVHIHEFMKPRRAQRWNYT